MTKAIMIQGAGSNVGKSLLVAGLARAYTLNGQETQAQEAAGKASSLQPVFGVPDPIRFSVEERAVDRIGLAIFAGYVMDARWTVNIDTPADLAVAELVVANWDRLRA